MDTAITRVASMGTDEMSACQRCGHRDRRGLTTRLGLRLCGVCVLIAKARAAAQR